MKTILLCVCVLLICLASFTHAACTGSSPTWAASPDYESVSACVSAANTGDTINVSAGTATWNQSLLITKGINLKGNGSGNTVITSNVANPGTSSSPGNPLIRYIPTQPQLNEAFEVSGFTFKVQIQCFYMEHITTNRLSKIRIHHNRFLSLTDVTYQAIRINGMIYGSVDNNIFEGNAAGSSPVIKTGGGQDKVWNNYKPSYNAADLPYRLYIEDNVITLRDTFVSCGHGGRYVARYNTIYSVRPSGSISPLFDAHGNQTGLLYGTQVTELYGNKYSVLSGTTSSPRFFDHRGGLGLAFYNQTSDVSYTDIRVTEETDDAVSPVNYVGIDAPQVPQHVSDAHYWANYDNLGVITVAEGTDVTSVITENDTYYRWDSVTAFDGTLKAGAGVGCGTLANRPATCTTGVAYWSTDQSCSDLTGMVGASPSTPISGTLYKCNASGEWIPYYTPYTYPHPLRGATTISGGVSISGGSIQ